MFRPGQPFKLRVTVSSATNVPVNIECGIVDTKQKIMIASQSGVFSPGES